MKALTALMIAIVTMIGIGTYPGTKPTNPHTPPPIPHVRHK